MSRLVDKPWARKLEIRISRLETSTKAQDPEFETWPRPAIAFRSLGFRVLDLFRIARPTRGNRHPPSAELSCFEFRVSDRLCCTVSSEIPIVSSSTGTAYSPCCQGLCTRPCRGYYRSQESGEVVRRSDRPGKDERRRHDRLRAGVELLGFSTIMVLAAVVAFNKKN